MEETQSPWELFSVLEKSVNQLTWYSEQLSDIGNSDQFNQVLLRCQAAEYKNLAITLELITRKSSALRSVLKGILFAEGDPLENADKLPLILEQRPESKPIDPEELLKEYIEGD